MAVTLNISMKKNFFDFKELSKKTGDANLRNRGRAGAMVRRTARQYLRYARKAPPHPSPGPPRVRVTGTEFGLRTILFANVDGSTIVGPLGSGRSNHPVAEIHEKGVSVVRRFHASGRRLRSNAKRRSAEIVKTVNYPERPYMQPSLVKSSPQFPSLWKDSIK